MSGMDYINYVHLLETQQDSQNQTKLMDLQSYAQHVAKTAGKEPMNWYEFAKAHPPGKHEGSTINALFGMFIGGGLGAFAAVGVAFVGAVTGGAATLLLAGGLIGGAVIGGVVGNRHEHPNEMRTKQLKRYEAYLNAFEQTQGRAPGLAMAMEGAGDGREFQDKVLASRLQPQMRFP